MRNSNKVIFWDFDGTLADSPGLWRGALLDVLDAHEPGHKVRMEQIRPFLREGFFWHRPEESHCHLQNADDWWEALNPVFIKTYEGVGFPAARARELAGLVRQYYVKPSRFKLYADAVPVLTLLKAAGWRHFILSNHVPELADIVHQIGLAACIDRCISSAVSGYEKPNPLAFANALRLAGHPRNVWMVGDNPVADISGAETAGIRAILVHSPLTPDVKHYAADLDAAARIILTEETV